MREIAEQLSAWLAAGQTFAIATVVRVSGSAPRAPGAAMAVDAAGVVVGSVSGGCVEASVYDLCQEVLRTGRPTLQRFGYSDEDAFAVGLTCGGVIEVLVQAVRPGGDEGLEAGVATLSAHLPVALAWVIAGPEDLFGTCLSVDATRHHGRIGPRDTRTNYQAERIEGTVIAQARVMLDADRSGLLTVDPNGLPCGAQARGAIAFFIASHAAPARMLVFGANDFAAAVTGIGRFLRYRVTVCDARPAFATAARFPGADEIVVDWPHRYLEHQAAAGGLDSRTVVCVLTHDPKFDVPLLQLALQTPLGYVGAMGSRRAHHARMERLLQAGLTEEQLAGLRSPIGLDLGASTPEETAVSIAAEIVAHRRGGGCLPLIAGEGRIH